MTCSCGKRYGLYDYNQQCNFTCPIQEPESDTESETAATAQCGGIDANTILYSVDSDPSIRITRVTVAYDDPASYDDARKKCVEEDGDLVVFAAITPYVEELAEEIPRGEYWIGLAVNSHTNTLAWVNPTSQV